MNGIKQLKLETLLLNQKYSYIDDFKISNRELLFKIRDLLDRGKKLKYIKKYLHKELIELYNIPMQGIEDLINQQVDIFNNISEYKVDKLNNNDVFTMGLNLKDLINAKIYYHLNLVVKDLINSNLHTNMIKSKVVNNISSSTYDYLKAYREDLYTQIDKKDNNIRGWLYTAILDRRTSKLCIGLNNRFFSRKVYKYRSSLPYIPNVNTHRRCRSSLITIYKDDDIKEFKNLSLDEFVKNEKYEVKKLIGEKKYKLLIDNNLSFSDIFDNKNFKFYSNKEIISKMNK